MTTIIVLMSILLPKTQHFEISAVVLSRSSALGLVELTSEQASTIGRAVLDASDQHGIRPAVILAVIEAESAYKASARSDARCVGLMQLNPSTAPDVARSVGLRKYNLRDIGHGIRLGAAYLHQLFRRYGRWDYALTAYNKGPGRFRSQRYAVSRYAGFVIQRAVFLEEALKATPPRHDTGFDGGNQFFE